MPSFLNNPVFLNITNRLVTLLGAVALLFVVVLKLDPVIVGFYYTFYSMAFMRFFAEVGMATVVVQTVSHAIEHAQRDPARQRYVYALIRFYVLWFLAISLIFSAVFIPVIYLFSNRIAEIDNGFIRIVVPWFIFAIGTGASVALAGLTSIVEGHKRVLVVSQIRLVSSLTNFLLTAILFLAGFEMWSLAFGTVVGAMLGGVLLLRQLDTLQWPANARQTSVNWRREIWPFQWRVAASWIAGFFIFYFLTPLVMRVNGPESAAQLGLSLQIFQTVTGTAIIAVSTYAAVLGGLVARGELVAFDQRFKKVSLLATALFAVLLGGFWFAYWLAPLAGMEILHERLLNAHLLVLLSLSALGTHVFFLTNYYLRCFKDEGLWWVSALNGIATLALASLLVPYSGVMAAVGIFTFNSIFFWCVVGAPVTIARRKLLIFNFSADKKVNV